MKHIHLIIVFVSIFLIGIVIDLLFIQFIQGQIGIWDNLIVALFFTFILWYFDHKRRTHICHFTIPISNKEINENIRVLTHKCVCGKLNETTVHVESVAYKEFIHEI